MKKNCNIIKDLLPLYIDDVCSKESKLLVEEHIKECSDCQKYLEELKFDIKESKINEVNVFKKFVKKINFKIIRNAILITILLIMISIPILRFVGSHKFIMEYDERMEIIIHDRSKKWNFEFNSPMNGYIDAAWIPYTENGEAINLIFINWKYTIQDYIESKDGVGAGTAPMIDYQNINPKDNMRVYYTIEEMSKIKNASKEELETIINNSTLIFTNDKTTSNIICNMNNKEYNYTLTYYSINKQIIESIGDNDMPEELLMNIYSINGDYKSTWFPGDKAADIFKQIEEYMTSNGGTCTLDNTN